MLVDSGAAALLAVAQFRLVKLGFYWPLIRRFKNVIRSSPDLEDDWYQFSNERRRGRARSWLAGAGYHPEQRVYRCQGD